MRLVLPEADRPLRPARRPLGRLLVERGLIRASDVLVTLGHQRVGDAHLGDWLLSQGVLEECALYETLAEQHDAEFVTRASHPPQLELQQGLDGRSCLSQSYVPWSQSRGGTVIATARPDHFQRMKAQLPAHLHPITMAIAPRSEIEAVITEGRAPQLAKRAEYLVPDDLSCRSLPDRLKTVLSVLLPLLVLALALQWTTPGALYRALFGFAVVMVATGMLIKVTAALLQLAAQSPLGAAPPPLPDRLPSISLLIPLHDEADILTALLQRIGLIDYPKALLDVILVIEQSDAATLQHLQAAKLPHWMRVLRVPPGKITTKPRAMNYALPFCRGQIVGIYDAEDAPHPNQLREVAAGFAQADEKTACLQAVLDFYNARSNALARFFTIEYAAWFRLILPGLSRMGFAIPLGGTSVFFRRDILEKLHGWDAHNVTEDADLGIRLARAGYRTALISSVTLEEANNAPWAWIKQRSRWLKGYLITYLTHMRRPIRLLFELGLWKYLGFQAFFLSSISQYMLAPLVWSCMLLYLGFPEAMARIIPAHMLGWLMLAFVAMWCLSTLVYCLAVSGRHHRHLIPWTLGMSVYMTLGTLAIYKGAWELIRRPFYWDKTAHGHAQGAQAHPPVTSTEPASSLSRVTKATEM